MVLNYLGYSMIEKKINLTEAMDMVKKAVELKPNDGYIVDSLGWAYFQLGDYEEASIHIERAVDSCPPIRSSASIWVMPIGASAARWKQSSSGSTPRTTIPSPRT